MALSSVTILPLPRRILETKTSSHPGEDNRSASEDARVSSPPPPKSGLWILDRADALIGEIALAVWLVIASIWRIPRAVIASDSIVRLENLIAARQILPPRMNLLVASIASALFLAWQLPERTPHQSTNSLLDRLTTTSPENWLIVAAPALISLWITVNFLAHVLRRAAGPGSTESTTLLMEATSSMAILSCIGTIAIFVWETNIKSLMSGLPDLLINAGFLLMIVFLAVAGWRCAQQTAVPPPCLVRRRRLVLFLGPLTFISSSWIALTATYWLLQAQASASRAMSQGEPPGYPIAFSPSCYTTDVFLVCEALLATRSDLAVGALQQVDVEWRDLTRSGAFKEVSLFQQKSQVVQTAPRVDPGGFWMLHAKEPLPFAFQVPKPDACRLNEQIVAFRQRVEPLPGTHPQPLEVRFRAYWGRGFGLVRRNDAAVWDPAVTAEFADPNFDSALAALCSGIKRPE